MNKFVLIVAGEDSGDILGKPIVCAVKNAGHRAVGSGGEKMKSAGLETIVPFDEMAVSGFGAVLRNLPKLLGIKRKLKEQLSDENCIALICIDYPGLNMSLLKVAKKIGKPVIYVSPPKIWIWKKSRGKYFDGVCAVVQFPFEQSAYQKCNAKTFLFAPPSLFAEGREKLFENRFLLLPGSRIWQIKNNLNAYIKIARNIKNAVFVASRKSTADFLRLKLKDEFPVVLKASETSFEGALGVLCSPGTASLEATIAGVPNIALMNVGFFTGIIAKLFLRTNYYTLPNILLQRKTIPEYLFFRGIPERKIKEISDLMLKMPNDKTKFSEIKEEIRNMLSDTKLEDIMVQNPPSQFLRT